MTITRRKFLAGAIGAAGLFMAEQNLLPSSARSAHREALKSCADKALVIVHLAGGNDGINTVIPYGSGVYYQSRPTLAFAPADVLPLNGQIGLHKNMTALLELYRRGKVAIALGVGYPNPTRSHFRSIEIWHTAEPDRIVETGWLGRYLDLSTTGAGASESIFPALNMDPVLSGTLLAAKAVVPSLTNPQTRSALDSLLEKANNYRSEVDYPHNDFARRLKLIAQSIIAGAGARFYNLTIGGFDTHADQAGPLANLLKQLSDGLASFQFDLETHGVDRDVLVMTFSEFGRSVAENDDAGTDHGTAAPLFVVGSGVKGGIYGDYPSLTKLDQGYLKYSIDFRTVYATLLDRWLGADSTEVLAGVFDCLPFI